MSVTPPNERLIANLVRLISDPERLANTLERLARNVCGECNMCCTTMGVQDQASGLDKPEWVTCPHARSQGCAIYETRPDNCADWLCLWKMLVDDPKLRPDKCGLVMSLHPEGMFVESCYPDNRGLWPDRFENTMYVASRFIQLPDKVMVCAYGYKAPGPDFLVTAMKYGGTVLGFVTGGPYLPKEKT